MARHAPEIIALQALGWIAGQEDTLAAFMAASGLGPSDLRARAADPEFLASVLDFLLTEDAWVMGFCDAAGLDYGTPGQARAGLPGGEAVHWT